MKKFISIISIAAMILVAGACNKQNQPDEGPVKASDLKYLVGGLMRIDGSGQVTGYMYGDNLNPADPYEVTVPVDSYEEAVALFMDLLPEGASVSQDATSVTWNMTDEDGKPEGKAVLKKNEQLGAIASLTVTPLLQASGSMIIPSVTFLPSALWPENAGAAEEILKRDYYVGAAVWKEKDEGFGKGEFLVIREWTSKESGIMIQMSDHKYPSNNIAKGASSMNTLHRVHKALMANYDLLVEGYGKAHGWPSLDKWYMSSDDEWFCGGYLNLKTGKEKWSFLELSVDYCYLVSVYCFKPDGKKIKFW